MLSEYRNYRAAIPRQNRWKTLMERIRESYELCLEVE